MANTKNARHGRLTILSGDTTPLTRTVALEQMDLNWSKTREVVSILERGALDHLRRGNEAPMTWSFSAYFEDKGLFQVMDKMVWDGTAEALAGLTGGALNAAVATAYPYEQNSLQVASTEVGFTKLALDAAPVAAGDLAENSGQIDSDAIQRGTTFDVFMPAADVDLNIVYDAYGRSTLDPTTSDVRTFNLRVEVLDPTTIKQTTPTVLETYLLQHCVVQPSSFAEGAEANTWSFSGISFSLRPTIT